MREILGNERLLGDLAYLASMQLVLVRPKFLLGDFFLTYLGRYVLGPVEWNLAVPSGCSFARECPHEEEVSCYQCIWRGKQAQKNNIWNVGCA